MDAAPGCAGTGPRRGGGRRHRRAGDGPAPAALPRDRAPPCPPGRHPAPSPRRSAHRSGWPAPPVGTRSTRPRVHLLFQEAIDRAAGGDVPEGALADDPRANLRPAPHRGRPTSAAGWDAGCRWAARSWRLLRTPKYCPGVYAEGAPGCVTAGDARPASPGSTSAVMVCGEPASGWRSGPLLWFVRSTADATPTARRWPAAGLFAAPAGRLRGRRPHRSPRRRRRGPASAAPARFTLVATGDVLVHQGRALDRRGAASRRQLRLLRGLRRGRTDRSGRRPRRLPPRDAGRPAAAGPTRATRASPSSPRSSTRSTARATTCAPPRPTTPWTPGSTAWSAPWTPWTPPASRTPAPTAPRPSADPADPGRRRRAGRPRRGDLLPQRHPAAGGHPVAVDVFDVPGHDGLLAAAARARAAGAEVVVASLHCCAEYDHEPTAAQVAAVRTLLASPDVDLVLGHHAHVVQPLERIDGEWVAYGLGNPSPSTTPAATRPRTRSSPGSPSPAARTAGSPSPRPRRCRCRSCSGTTRVTRAPADPATFDAGGRGAGPAGRRRRGLGIVPG